jgi:hypothetical protein
MPVEEGDPAAIDAQPLPHAIAKHEARIEHRNLRLGPGEQLPIHVDQHVVVARIGGEHMRAGGVFGHGGSLLRRSAYPVRAELVEARAAGGSLNGRTSTGSVRTVGRGRPAPPFCPLRYAGAARRRTAPPRASSR